MISPERRKTLIGQSLRLRDAFLRFRSPSSGKAVAPSHLGELIRYVQDRPSKEDLLTFLKMLPGSHYSKVSKGAGPQLQEVARQASQLVGQVPDMEELLFVLGWTRRLLGNEDRGGGSEVQRSNDPHRSNRGGYASGRR